MFTLPLLFPASGRAATYSVPAFTGDAVQQTLNTAYRAGSNNTVLLPAGQYSVTTPIIVPCDNGLTVTGPEATSPQAVLEASYTGNPIFQLFSCNGITIQYLHFANTGGIYLGITNHTNVTITHNEFTGLPSTVNGSSRSDAAIYIDGTINTNLTHFVAAWNVFGDPGSCSAVFTTVTDEGGNCIGIHAQPGIAVDSAIEHNFFNHVEEGVHYAQLTDGSAPAGTSESVTQNLQIRYNYFLNWHRIAIEVQGGVINVGQQISDNVLASPINPSYGTMFISVACCTGGRTYLTSSPPNAPDVTENNLLWTATNQEVGPFLAPVIGIEYSGGAGSLAKGNFVMGNFSNQINWGHGVKPWYVESNYLCAAHFGGYITEEVVGVSPVISGNTESATCRQQVSTASTISLPSGAYQSPQTLTLANKGRNTSIYYTTDGSTPLPGHGTTQLYTAPFSLNLPATVKTVGMWGVAPQPTSYPAPYGFVPSAVATATYRALTTRTLVSVVLTDTDASQSLAVGQSIQMLARCTYSDGSVTICNSKDKYGNAVTSWQSSSAAVSINASGLARAVVPGQAHITAEIAGIRTLPWLFTVNPPETTRTLVSVVLTDTDASQSLAVGQSIQMLARCTYSDGSVTICNSKDKYGNAVTSWQSSSAAVSINASGLAKAVVPGQAHITAEIVGTRTLPWLFTVNPPETTRTLVSVVLTDTDASQSLAVGQSVQMLARCTYSDGSVTICNSKDKYGNAVTSWQSSSAAVSINASGLAKAVVPGYAHITAEIVGTRTLPWLFAVNPPEITKVYLTTPGNAGTVAKGGTLQISAYAVYSDGVVSQLPDDRGDKVELWNTSNHEIATVSSGGRLTALSTGVVSVAAYLRSTAVACSIKVIAPRSSAPSEVSQSATADPQAVDGKMAGTAAQSQAPSGPVKSVASVAPMGPGAPVEDYFDEPLWSLAAPAGGSASISQGHLFLGLPGGSNHDAFSGENDTVRVLQPLNGQDFEVSMKIDSLTAPADAGTSQGLLLESDSKNFVTFAMKSEGNGVGLSLHTVINGSDSAVIGEDELIPFSSQVSLRFVRAGETYTALYSLDGENWIEVTTFHDAINAKAIGPFAANRSDPPADAVPVVMSVASFDLQQR